MQNHHSEDALIDSNGLGCRCVICSQLCPVSLAKQSMRAPQEACTPQQPLQLCKKV